MKTTEVSLNEDEEAAFQEAFDVLTKVQNACQHANVEAVMWACGEVLTSCGYQMELTPDDVARMIYSQMHRNAPTVEGSLQ